MKPALLIVDIQQAFFESDPVAAGSLAGAIEYVNAAIDLFRPRQLPVVVIQHLDEDDGLVPGTEGFTVPGSVKHLPTDLWITKTHGNSFVQTDLADKLRRLGVDTVILTGYCAEFCVLSTCRGAKDLGFTPILLRGALASGHPERIRFVEEINDVVSYGALKAVLNGV